MTYELEEYGAVIDMGGGGEVYVQRQGVGWIASHVSYSGSSGGLIGDETTWARAMQTAIDYAAQGRRPRA